LKNNVIEARGIVKQYPKGARALDGVDLSVPEGSRFVLLGPNGAGKSTLVRILCTLSRPDEGAMTICGLDPEKKGRELMRLIGVAGQENDLDPEERVKEHLLFQGSLFGLGRQERQSRTEELIDSFRLGEHALKKVKELSGGNKRKLHCALSLVHRPKLLFLDEPTVGMDPEIRHQFWESLRRVNREEGMTLFLTTQYLEEADRHADELALLDRGKICYRGTVDSFKSLAEESGVKSLEEGYLHYLKEVEYVAG
jgi:ABC-2 type transport system ATP-binding protein